VIVGQTRLNSRLVSSTGHWYAFATSHVTAGLHVVAVLSGVASREGPPRAARADDPEDAGEDQAVVGIRAPGLGLLWWEQACNAVPALIGQLELVHVQPLDGGRPERRCLLLASASGVAVLGNCLMPSAKGRPAQSEAAARGWFGDGEEQPTNLGYGQREEVRWPPFSPAVASRRVTSR